jgi:hypothetical protein
MNKSIFKISVFLYLDCNRDFNRSSNFFRDSKTLPNKIGHEKEIGRPWPARYFFIIKFLYNYEKTEGSFKLGALCFLRSNNCKKIILLLAY